MAKKALREPVSYRLREIETGEALVTEPITAEHYLVVMETTWREAAELDRLNCDPENLKKRYMDSFLADRDVAVEAMDRLWGSIKLVRRCIATDDWKAAVPAMYEAADSHRKLLDNDYIEQLRNTDKATDARIKKQQDRHSRLKEYAERHGNPPPIPKRKDRTAWILRCRDKLSSDNKKVSVKTIRADLDSLGL